jgi:hypothetical protein
MATQHRKHTGIDENLDPVGHHVHGFDVVVEKFVGRVESDPSSNLSFHEAAFLMVAQQDEPGTYSWVNNGHEVKLHVEYPQTDPN